MRRIKRKTRKKALPPAQVEKHRVSGMGHGAGKMVVKFGSITSAATIALMNDGISDAAINLASSIGEALVSNPYGTAAMGGAAVAFKGHEFITQKAPKMLALASLAKANFTGDRRHLDQLTEINTIKAAGQLHNLKLGYSI